MGGYPRWGPPIGGTPERGLMGVGYPRWGIPCWGYPPGQGTPHQTWLGYPPSGPGWGTPPPDVNRLKTLPSLVLRTRSVNMCEQVHGWKAMDLSWFWNPSQTLPDVHSRATSGPTKRTSCQCVQLYLVLLFVQSLHWKSWLIGVDSMFPKRRYGWTFFHIRWVRRFAISLHNFLGIFIITDVFHNPSLSSVILNLLSALVPSRGMLILELAPLSLVIRLMIKCIIFHMNVLCLLIAACNMYNWWKLITCI